MAKDLESGRRDDQRTAAPAAVTERVRFGTDIFLIPFNHPIRLAEDLAMLDNVSNSRVELGLGMGRAPVSRIRR